MEPHAETQTFGAIRPFATSFANGLLWCEQWLVYSAVIAAQMVSELKVCELNASYILQMCHGLK